MALTTQRSQAPKDANWEHLRVKLIVDDAPVLPDGKPFDGVCVTGSVYDQERVAQGDVEASAEVAALAATLWPRGKKAVHTQARHAQTLTTTVSLERQHNKSTLPDTLTLVFAERLDDVVPAKLEVGF